ncbi:uncharacterized protein LOC142323042 isoform X2 [Lycorma delicatula]|uniref:uncharacterized protein LOC142323042 isoform X2 n=1 Tax=Lycorma delicatula TaxID=130591 RepID=UPI003F50DFC0
MQGYNCEFMNKSHVNCDNTIGYGNDFSLNWSNGQNCSQNVVRSEGFIRSPLPPIPPPPLPPPAYMNYDQQLKPQFSGAQFPHSPAIQRTDNTMFLSDSTYCYPETNVNVQQCTSSYPQECHQFQMNRPPVAASYMMYNHSLNTLPQQQANAIAIHPNLIIKDGTLLFASEEYSIDENWIKNWLNRIGKSSSTSKLIKNELSTSSSKIKIHEVKEKVTEIKKLLCELEHLSKSLSVMYKSLNDDVWKSRCVEIEEKKKMLSDLLGSLVKNKEFLFKVGQNLKKRRKKRERQKRKQDEWKREKMENGVRRQQLHQNIDKWLEDMQDSVERGRREEELKREADCVLADVTRKKSESKRQIALLSELLKLRQARVTALKATGKNISQQQTEAFNSVIERLKSLWTNQLKDYMLEEQGLKVMLNEAAVEEKNSEDLRRKEALSKWEVTLFGDNKTTKYQPHDFVELVTVRRIAEH